MTRAYQTPREHLDDTIALVGQLVERQIVAHWETGVLPRIKDAFSGTFVSGSEVAALIAGGLPGTPEGQRKLADLDAAIGAREEWIEAKLAASEQAGQPVPLDQLRRAFALTPTEQRVLAVLIAVETSARLRQLMRYLVNEATRIYADLGLLELLVYATPATRDALVYELAPTGKLFRHRLVDAIGGARAHEEAPFLLRAVKASSRVIELAYGAVRLDRELADLATLVQDVPAHDELVGADELKAQATQLVRDAAGGHAAPALVLTGLEGAGKKALLFGAARALGCSVLHVACEQLPVDAEPLQRALRALLREAVLFRAVPLFENIDLLASDPDRGRADRAAIFDRELATFAGPICGTCARRDTRPFGLARGILLVDVPLPTEAERATLWRRALGPFATGVDADRAAARYPVTGGVIARAAASAHAHARSRGAPIDDLDLHAGIRATLDSKLSALGVRVTWRQTWSDLVLPEDAMAEIREFVARVRHRRRVYEEWGFARKVAKGLGLSALFSGPPGTGKTMVAGIIADELALDLYQIDLSRIVSKYVGETEKNLAQVFDAAEAGHAILLFDEADSLFAKRTEVKSSVDRYANLEVNYLLQRMEAFRGITILTTNLDASIDEAFRRRISFRIQFPLPEVEDRERLWRSMLPKQARVDPAINFHALASKFELAGGHIRNAVLRAAFMAADEDSAIRMDHMHKAAVLEYAAMGKLATAATL
ncbi:MAG TPA: ATP-binding protein [Kofleriaceae bacterium]